MFVPSPGVTIQRVARAGATTCARAIACVLCVLLPAAAHATDDNDAGIWIVNQIAVPLDQRVAAHVMVQNRWVENVDSYQRTVVRPWLSFDWTEQVELALGYDAHFFENPVDTLENRAWQRIAFKYDFGVPAVFTHFWLEERFFERSDEVAWRGRFQLGGSVELPMDFGFVLRNEWFVNLNTTPLVRRTGLRENHFAVALNHPLGRWLRIETGYTLRYLDLPGRDVFDHLWVIGFSATTPALFDLF
jgi:hypothetical protein